MDNPNAAIEQLRQLDALHLLHPFTDMPDMASRGGTRIITRGEGVWIWDETDKKILDGMSGLWCLHVGYARQELIEAAHRQLTTLSFYNQFFRTATEPAIELAAELVALAAPIEMQRVFYANSGSEAVETALRLVRRFWDLRGRPEKNQVIGRHFAYHGTTAASASVGGMPPMQVQGGLPLPGYHHIMRPDPYRMAGDLTYDEFGLIAAQALEQEILSLGAANVAAFFAEPVMGAGGVVIPPATYFPEIQRICRKYDVLLVADEVVCAFGRIGHWFGSHAFALEPDIITIAKGLTSGYFPLSATLLSPRIDDALRRDGGEFCYGYTYSGHPVGCAVALANIEVLKKESLIEKARESSGPDLLANLQAKLKAHPIVGEVRGLGMIFAIELAEHPASKTAFAPEKMAGQVCRDYALACGLVMRAVGDTLLLAPPLTITAAESNILIDAAYKAIDATATILRY